MIKKFILKNSKIQGEGIFASRNYNKHDFVVKLTGKKIIWKYNDKKDREYCANWFGMGNNLWIDPNFPLSKINHSCDPNLGIKGSIFFYAMKNIKAGEELTFDYSTSEEEINWKMKCKCGSKKCRGNMTSIQLLPKNIYDDYLPYIPKYFQKVYKCYNKL
jgi:hypothetical protein